VNRDALFSYHKESEMFLQVLHIVTLTLTCTLAMETDFNPLYEIDLAICVFCVSVAAIFNRFTWLWLEDNRE
jgi:hypothetical protein